MIIAFSQVRFLQVCSPDFGLHAVAVTPAMPVEPSQVVDAYRQLYRAGLYAIRYSKPARYTLRHLMNKAFRNSSSSAYNAKKIQNTVLFLRHAGEGAGLEHRILKGLLHTRSYTESRVRRKFVLPIRRPSYQRNIVLNKT